MNRKIIYLVIFSAFSKICCAQEHNPIFIKGDYYNKPLTEFINEMESEYNIHFFYTRDAIENITVSGIFRYKTPFSEAFTQLLKPTNLSFNYNDNGNIVIFKDRNKHIIKTKEQYYKLSGLTQDKATGDPLPYVSVFIPGLSKGDVSDENGAFEIKPVPKGSYQVKFNFVGYKPIMKNITIDGNEQITVDLEEAATELKEVVITPGALEISTVEVSPMQLSKEEILHSPNFAKDIYRTLRTLPGIASNDFSAKARIRGGHSEEVALYLDYFQINEPFHLEGVDGTFSIFNTDYVDKMKVLPGGFSARYTDKLSGIIDMSTSDNVEADQYRLFIDFLNAGIFTQKKLSDKTNVFVSARRGYLDLLINGFENFNDTDELQPTFYDVWSKVTLDAYDKHKFSFNFLFGRDNFRVADDANYSAEQKLYDKRNNLNGWINWKWFPDDNFQSITTIGYQGISKDDSFSFIENVPDDNMDNSDTKTAVLTHNSYWDIDEQNTLNFGFEFKRFWADYNYKDVRFDIYNSTPDNIKTDSLFIDKMFNGYLAAGYVQHSWEPIEKLVIQPGIRVSSQSFTDGANWSPRLAMRYQISESLSTNLGFGIYYQPDLYYKLRTSLGQSMPYKLNSKSIHYTGNLKYSRQNLNVQVNAYYKDYPRLYDDFRYEFFNRLGGVSILDIPFNTEKGYSKGIEFIARKQYGQNHLLSISYTYAVNKIINENGEETYRSFDQPHSIIINNLFRLPYHWNISLLWRYHTGYPYTPTSVQFIGERQLREGYIPFYNTEKKNSSRLPATHSLDVRFEKSWYFKKSKLTAYLNVVNLYNHDNIRSYWWDIYRNRSTGKWTSERAHQVNIPFFISPGLSFTLY